MCTEKTMVFTVPKLPEVSAIEKEKKSKLVGYLKMSELVYYRHKAHTHTHTHTAHTHTHTYMHTHTQTLIGLRQVTKKL